MIFNLDNYKIIKEKIEKKQKNVEIVAISKFHPKESVNEALKHGLRVFGENRVQEALEKYTDFKEKFKDIELHFTGNIQTNKIKQALEIFDVFHTICKEKQLKELSKYPEKIKIKKFFVQVNTGYEKTKGGLYPEDLKEFLNLSYNKYMINVVGLMCIPPLNEKPSKHFSLLKTLKEKFNLQKLSMGMSNDYEEAIDSGSDYIRIGTMLFGERN